MSCEAYEPLLSAWVDGELTGDDRAAVQAHLGTCERCRRAADELAAVARSTRAGLVPPDPPAVFWDGLGARVVQRISRRSGWWLLVPAAILLAGYAGYQLATDETVDALVKVGVAGGALGVALLLLSVLIDRLRDRRLERYGGGGAMIVVTCDAIPGRRIVEVFGLVRGNAVRSRHLGKDILALLRNIVGGEVHEYTKMLAETREQALDRMIEEAEEMGANAIVTLRLVSAEVSAGAAELLAYGTAVRTEPE